MCRVEARIYDPLIGATRLVETCTYNSGGPCLWEAFNSDAVELPKGTFLTGTGDCAKDRRTPPSPTPSFPDQTPPLK